MPPRTKRQREYIVIDRDDELERSSTTTTTTTNKRTHTAEAISTVTTTVSTMFYNRSPHPSSVNSSPTQPVSEAFLEMINKFSAIASGLHNEDNSAYLNKKLINRIIYIMAKHYKSELDTIKNILDSDKSEKHMDSKEKGYNVNTINSLAAMINTLKRDARENDTEENELQDFFSEHIAELEACHGEASARKMLIQLAYGIGIAFANKEIPTPRSARVNIAAVFINLSASYNDKVALKWMAKHAIILEAAEEKAVEAKAVADVAMLTSAKVTTAEAVVAKVAAANVAVAEATAAKIAAEIAAVAEVMLAKAAEAKIAQAIAAEAAITKAPILIKEAIIMRAMAEAKAAEVMEARAETAKAFKTTTAETFNIKNERANTAVAEATKAKYVAERVVEALKAAERRALEAKAQVTAVQTRAVAAANPTQQRQHRHHMGKKS